MRLTDSLRGECVAVNLTLNSKEEALDDIARLAVQSPALQGVDAHTIATALREREAIGSTAFGNGVAIPHCRLENVSEFVVGIVTVPAGVPFEALDDNPVRLIVFIVGPTRESDEHIRILSEISQALSIPGSVEEIVAAPSAQAARESFLRHLRDEIDTGERPERSLVQVIVQNEDLFRDILQVMASVNTSSVMVLDAQNSNAFLRKMPLFAGFWSDETTQFCRMIVGTVDKNLTNETIRRVEQVCGDLNNRRDVMLLVQEVFYSAGFLQV